MSDPEIVDVEILCGIAEASCDCSLAGGHDGAHQCLCGGSWTYDAHGRFVPITMPQSMDGVVR